MTPAVQFQNVTEPATLCLHHWSNRPLSIFAVPPPQSACLTPRQNAKLALKDGDSAGFELLFSPKWWVAMIHPYICCGCVSFRVLPVLPIFMVINLHGFSPVQCTATFTDESVGCIMKPEFAPHLTRGQHICCSWLSKHCHCGARQKENFPRFSSFFSGCLGWWVRKHWEWLRITETTVDTWNISVFLPCSSEGSVLGPPWIWVIGIRQNMSHQDCFQWNLSRLIIPSLTLWQRLFPGHKHHWTQYSHINYLLISFFRGYYASIKLWTSGMMIPRPWSLVPNATQSLWSRPGFGQNGPDQWETSTVKQWPSAAGFHVFSAANGNRWRLILEETIVLFGAHELFVASREFFAGI